MLAPNPTPPPRPPPHTLTHAIPRTDTVPGASAPTAAASAHPARATSPPQALSGVVAPGTTASTGTGSAFQPRSPQAGNGTVTATATARPLAPPTLPMGGGGGGGSGAAGSGSLASSPPTRTWPVLLSGACVQSGQGCVSTRAFVCLGGGGSVLQVHRKPASCTHGQSPKPRAPMMGCTRVRVPGMATVQQRLEACA
jgi:hypothetical protein